MNSTSAGNDTVKISANTTSNIDENLFKNKHLDDYLLIVLFCLVILTTVVSTLNKTVVFLTFSAYVFLTIKVYVPTSKYIIYIYYYF